MKIFFTFLLSLTFSFNLFALSELVQLGELKNDLNLLNQNLNSMTSSAILEDAKQARKIFANQGLDENTRIDANLVYSGFVGLYGKKNDI